MTLNVKELRTKKGLSQQELADLTGIPKGRINNWEQGLGNPKAKDYETLMKLERGEIKVFQNQNSMTTKDEQDPGEVYRKIVEGDTEYLLIPRSVLQEKYRLVAIEQIQKDQAFYAGQAETIKSLIQQIDKLNSKPLNVQKAK